MYILNFILLALGFALLTGATIIDVSRMQVDDSHMIKATSKNYAFTVPTVFVEADHDWQSVSMNGNKVIVIMRDCSIREIRKNKLTKEEKNLIDMARSVFKPIEQRREPEVFEKYGLWKYVDEGNTVLSNGYNIGTNHHFDNGVIVHKNDERNCAITRYDEALPRRLSWIFINDEVATFVYQNGYTEMVPMSCLEGDELDLLNKLNEKIEAGDGRADENLLDEDFLRQVNDIRRTVAIMPDSFGYRNVQVFVE